MARRLTLIYVGSSTRCYPFRFNERRQLCSLFVIITAMIAALFPAPRSPSGIYQEKLDSRKIEDNSVRWRRRRSAFNYHTVSRLFASQG